MTTGTSVVMSVGSSNIFGKQSHSAPQKHCEMALQFPDEFHDDSQNWGNEKVVSQHKRNCVRQQCEGLHQKGTVDCRA